MPKSPVSNLKELIQDFIDRPSVSPQLQLMYLENVASKGHPQLLGPPAPGFNSPWVQIVTRVQTTKALCSGLQHHGCPATPSPASLNEGPLCAQGQGSLSEPALQPAAAHVPPGSWAQLCLRFRSSAARRRTCPLPAGLWGRPEPSGWEVPRHGEIRRWGRRRRTAPPAPLQLHTTSCRPGFQRDRDACHLPTSFSFPPCTCHHRGSKPVPQAGPRDVGHPIPSLLLSHFLCPGFLSTQCACACVYEHTQAQTHTGV